MITYELKPYLLRVCKILNSHRVDYMIVSGAVGKTYKKQKLISDMSLTVLESPPYTPMQRYPQLLIIYAPATG